MANDTPQDIVAVYDSQSVRKDIRQMLRVARTRADGYRNLDLTDPDSLTIRSKDHPSVAVFKMLYAELKSTQDEKVRLDLLKLLATHDAKVSGQIDKHLSSLISASVQAHKLARVDEGDSDPLAGKSEDEMVDEFIKQGVPRDEAVAMVANLMGLKDADVEAEG